MAVVIAEIEQLDTPIPTDNPKVPRARAGRQSPLSDLCRALNTGETRKAYRWAYRSNDLEPAPAHNHL